MSEAGDTIPRDANDMANVTGRGVPGMCDNGVYETKIEGLALLHRGKVRDIYEVGDDLLIVASDRLSAFDSVLPTPIPMKGKVLTGLTLFWLDFLKGDVRNHLIAADVDAMGDGVRAHADVLRGRSMLVRRAKPLAVECVVRGYLSGSAWASYQESGSVCGIALRKGLVESDKLPQPIFTPTTKAESGHDEPLDFGAAAGLVGEETARTIRDRSLWVYQKASEYAASRGVIIADTKFEWGTVNGELILIDEVLTPDSSRFWPADAYAPGRAQASFDKQYVRDWLNESGWDHEPPAPALPPDVVAGATERYMQAYEKIAGHELQP